MIMNVTGELVLLAVRGVYSAQRPSLRLCIVVQQNIFRPLDALVESNNTFRLLMASASVNFKAPLI